MFCRDNYDKEVKNRQAEQNKTTKSGLQKREMQTYVPPSRRLNGKTKKNIQL